MKHFIFVAGLVLAVSYSAQAAEPAKKEQAPAKTTTASKPAETPKSDGSKSKVEKECKMVKDEKTGQEKEKCTYPKKAEKK